MLGGFRRRHFLHLQHVQPFQQRMPVLNMGEDAGRYLRIKPEGVGHLLLAERFHIRQLSDQN